MNDSIKVNKLNNGVLLFENVLSEEECKIIIDHAEQTGFKTVPPTGGRQLVWSGIEASNVRNNQRIIEEHTEFTIEWSNKILQRIKQELSSDLEFRFDILPTEVNAADVCPTREKAKEWKISSVSDKFRMYKYEKKQHFLMHFDGTNRRLSTKLNEDLKPMEQFVEQSFLTMLIYLNNVEEGGDTQFFDNLTKVETFNIKPKRGSAVIFLHELLHQGNDVLKGCKYLLRTDICYKKKRKLIEQIDPKHSFISNLAFNKNDTTKKTKQKKGTKANSEMYCITEWQRMYHPSCKQYTD
ncbi:hypothetical protein ABK040_006752 [Willaertia magna]